MRVSIYQKIVYWATVYILASVFHEPLWSQNSSGNCTILVRPEVPDPSAIFSTTSNFFFSNNIKKAALNSLATQNSTIAFPTTPPNTSTANIDGFANLQIVNLAAPTLENLSRKLNRFIAKQRHLKRKSRGLPTPTGSYYFTMEITAYQITDVVRAITINGSFASDMTIPFSSIDNMTVNLAFPAPPLSQNITFNAVVFRQQ
jgi:hypothetical protein